MREPSFTAIDPLVRELSRALLPELDLPFAFVGHSMGALIAFELARLLRREHALSPAYMFVSARPAPQLPSFDAPIHLLPRAVFLEHLRTRYNGIPEAILREPELMELFLPTVRADFKMIESYDYVPREPLGCPMIAFGGLQDDLVTKRELRAWQEQTNAAFDLHMFPGGHFFLHQQRPQMLRTVAGYLRG
jgi:medium-chain acyl-[acyl-carrier-protein] hydrolase